MTPVEAWSITIGLAALIIAIPTKTFRWLVAAAVFVGLAVLIF